MRPICRYDNANNELAGFNPTDSWNRSIVPFPVPILRCSDQSSAICRVRQHYRGTGGQGYRYNFFFI
jgi:hypothetical protein